MEYRCTFRGKLKLENEYKEEKYFNDDIYVVGDNVEFSLENGYGVIDKLPERKNYISRKMPKIKGVTQKGRKKEQIIAANIDNTFIVTSVSSPQFNNRTLDRLLIISESCKTNPIIVINKIDIGTDEELNFWCDLYSNLNYEVILTSVITG